MTVQLTVENLTIFCEMKGKISTKNITAVVLNKDILLLVF